ncbi:MULTISPECIES: RDD family protein [unclassified Streptomyces]|uniref:RDD family protein n=1 Tax=unclassified Streptomyces TaxID=2593676 RepID=UPI0036EA0D7A
MSAPTPAPGDDRPREGYYPDPSIPGYVRYWNGTSWVPGTSRPAPSDGGAAAPAQGASSVVPPVEETGPHFFDEDPRPASEAQHGSRPEPASAWGADRVHQSGFGGDPDRRVSWGAAAGADPRVPSDTTTGDGTATIPPAESDAPPSGNTFVFRRPTPAGAAPSPAAPGTPGPAPAGPGVSGGPAFPAPAGPGGDEGTMTFRALTPRTAPQGGAQSGGTGGARPEGAAAGGFGPPAATSASSAPSVPGAAAGPQSAPGAPGFAPGKAAAERAAAAQIQAPAPAAPSGPQPPLSASPAPAVPAQSTPMASGVGGGQPSWAQQVHRLAANPDEEQPVTPWKPPVEDIFQAAARRQASARPAGLGKRLAARLLDTVVLVGVTGAAAVPLGTRALDHVNEKIDAAKLSGETVTVWLLDGTTSVYLGIVLAVLILFGVLYEALPTAKWGRTLGKKLFGLEVRDIEGGEPPTFGAALRRWLVYSVPGLLAIGVVGVVWGLFDKPWRQCWHDKAAHTFVAG